MPKLHRLICRRAFLGALLLAAISHLIALEAKSLPQSTSGGARAKADVPALELKQTNTFLGNYTVTIADDALCLKSTDRMGFVLISHRPDWLVTIYRTDDKVYNKQSFETFSQSGLSSEIVSKSYDRMRTGTRTKAKFGDMQSYRSTADGQVLEYLPLDKRDKQIEQVLYSALKVPTNGGIPIYFGRQAHGKDWITGIAENTHKTILKTTAARQIKVSRQIFELPAGLKPVKSIQEALCSKENRAGAEDFNEIFEIGKDHSKKNGK